MSKAFQEALNAELDKPLHREEPKQSTQRVADEVAPTYKAMLQKALRAERKDDVQETD